MPKTPGPRDTTKPEDEEVKEEVQSEASSTTDTDASKDESNPNEGKTLFKLEGSKAQGEVVDRIILEGSSVFPERYLDLDGTEYLTEEEEQDLRDRGYKLRKVSEDQQQLDEGQQILADQHKQRLSQMPDAPSASPAGSAGIDS